MDTKTRLDCRIDRQSKSLIEKAAAVSGQSISEFVIPDAVHKAERILQRHRTTVLSERDWKTFLTLLDSDAKPNEALKNAMTDFDKAYGA